jgi:hypothetical protein
MSVEIMSATFKAQIPDQEYEDKKGNKTTVKSSTLKLVLLALADHASDTGESVYPSIETIRLKTSIGSNSTVIAAIHGLENLGILTEVRKRPRGNIEYRITPSVISGLQPVKLTVTPTVNESSLTINKPKDSGSGKPPEPIIPGNPVVRSYDPDEVETPRKKIKIKKSADPRVFPFAQEIASLCSLAVGNGSDGELFRAAKLLVNCSGAPNKPHDLRQYFAKGGKIYHEWPWNKGERLKPMDIVKHWPRLSGAIKPPEVNRSTQKPYEEA